MAPAQGWHAQIDKCIYLLTGFHVIPMLRWVPHAQRGSITRQLIGEGVGGIPQCAMSEAWQADGRQLDPGWGCCHDAARVHAGAVLMCISGLPLCWGLCLNMRAPGVEPGAQAWEACMLPLHYARPWLQVEPRAPNTDVWLRYVHTHIYIYIYAYKWYMYAWYMRFLEWWQLAWSHACPGTHTFGFPSGIIR